MIERILVIFDGSAAADQAIDKAMERADSENKGLYILGIAADISRPASPKDAQHVTEGLTALGRLCQKMGIDVDGEYFGAATEHALREFITTRGFSELILAQEQLSLRSSNNAHVLAALAASSPVKTTVLS